MNTIIPKQKTIGMGFTVAATCFILWSVYTLAGRHLFADDSVRVEVSQLETGAIERLKEISRAQEKYRKTDWNEDQRKEYAMFLVHLWQSVSERDSSPRFVGLIDEELAFVSDSSGGLDGYQYDILTLRDDGAPTLDNYGKPTGIPLDFSNEWAAIAHPVALKELEDSSSPRGHPKTFVICCGNKIYSNTGHDSEIDTLPDGLESHGWAEIFK